MIAACFPRGSISTWRGSILPRTGSNFPGRRRGDRMLMRGITAFCDEFAGGFGEVFSAIAACFVVWPRISRAAFWVLRRNLHHSRIQHSLSALRARSGRSLEVRLTAVSDMGAISVCPTPSIGAVA